MSHDTPDPIAFTNDLELGTRVRSRSQPQFGQVKTSIENARCISSGPVERVRRLGCRALALGGVSEFGAWRSSPCAPSAELGERATMSSRHLAAGATTPCCVNKCGRGTSVASRARKSSGSNGIAERPSRQRRGASPSSTSPGGQLLTTSFAADCAIRRERSLGHGMDLAAGRGTLLTALTIDRRHVAALLARIGEPK